MNPFLSLALWRAVGAQADLSAALRAALDLLGPKLAATVAAVRFLVPEHRLWETVALAGTGPTQSFAGVDHVGEGQPAGLPATLKRERVLRIDPVAFGLAAPGLLPHAVREPLAAAVLCNEPRLTAVLLLAGLQEPALSAATGESIEALVEPLASALRHHVRERDAAALHEAAEADRRSLLNRLGR